MTDKKFSKSANFFIVIAALIALSVILAFFYFSFDGTGRLQWLLTFHKDELTDFAENFLKGEASSTQAFGAKRIYSDTTEGHRQVIFETGGSGLGSATSYHGFYYSPDDAFISCLQSATTVLDGESNGHIAHWKETTGDNECYVTRIQAHWYLWRSYF